VQQQHLGQPPPELALRHLVRVVQRARHVADEVAADRRPGRRVAALQGPSVGPGQDPVRGVHGDGCAAQPQPLQPGAGRLPHLGVRALVQQREAEAGGVRATLRLQGGMTALHVREPVRDRSAVQVAVGRAVVAELEVPGRPEPQRGPVSGVVADHEAGGRRPVDAEHRRDPLQAGDRGLAGRDGAHPGQVVDRDGELQRLGGRSRQDAGEKEGQGGEQATGRWAGGLHHERVADSCVRSGAHL
jgi:hypothetical protein